MAELAPPTRVNPQSADDHELVVLDVHDEISNAVLGQLQVNRKDFVAPNQGQAFSVPFTVPASPATLEYRVLYLGWSLVTHVSTDVAGGAPASPSPSPPPPVPPVASAFLYDLSYATSLPTLEVCEGGWQGVPHGPARLPRMQAGYEEEHIVSALCGLVNRAAPTLCVGRSALPPLPRT